MVMHDSDPFPIFCPKCQDDIQKTIGWLRDNESLDCPGCGTSLSAECIEARHGIEEAEKTLADDFSEPTKNPLD